MARAGGPADPVEGDPEDRSGRGQVDEAPRLDLRERDEQLRVRGLEQHEIERALADVLDDLEKGWAERPLQDALQGHEPAEHHEHLGERPAGDLRPGPEDDDQGKERDADPEQRQGAFDGELQPVLQRHRDRSAELGADHAGGAHHPPYAA